MRGKSRIDIERVAALLVVSVLRMLRIGVTAYTAVSF